MTLQTIPGTKRTLIGPSPSWQTTTPSTASVLIDAANEAFIIVGQIETEDGGSHTLDTSGSSAIHWRSLGSTFANGSTVVKVGFAPVDTTTGPPARASNVANVIAFDVSANLTGGVDTIVSGGYNTHVPTTGSKTIANGDFVAFAVQMTALGGADAFSVSFHAGAVSPHRPAQTQYLGGTYTAISGLPNIFIEFSDGTTGWFVGGNIADTIATATFNSGNTPDERGQLYILPFPYRVYGAYGWVDPDNDFEIVLYTALTSPTLRKTVVFDENPVASGTGRYFEAWFDSPYDVAANTELIIAAKPTTTSSIALYQKTVSDILHNKSDPWGSTGYGVGRTNGGNFTSLGSDLIHTFLGLIVGAYDDGASGGGGRVVSINSPALVS